MEIIEKEVIKHDEKEYASVGKANAALTTGIIGTALGAWALFGNRRNILGGGSGLGGSNININGLDMTGSSRTAPSAYEVQMKECEDVLALQRGLYDWALTQQNQRFTDRQVIDREMFGLYAKGNQDAFNLYKSQRDGDDVLAARLSNLECKVAVNEAIRPYQDKLIQCEIDKAFTAGINYTDRKTCKVIYGEVCLPNTPVVTGYVGANQCGCIRTVEAPTS